MNAPPTNQESQNNKAEVFILGAGFSKATSEEMPLTKELSTQVLAKYKHAKAIEPLIREMLAEDFEKALTFLAQPKPWLPEAENLRHRATYLDLTNIIRIILRQKSRSPETWPNEKPPPWLESLITYWHTSKATVLTLNYDTLIEIAASGHSHHRDRIATGSLYPIPLTPAAKRSEIAQRIHEEPPSPQGTFRLLKLHGSVNWFYSGQSKFFGEQIFYVPCHGGIHSIYDTLLGDDPEESHWKQTTDKTALIIPPVLDKSVFLQHESIRSLWYQAGTALKRATRVVCMGYSLPSSDLTMAQFLKTSAPPCPAPLDIVDIVPKVSHFQEILGAGTYNYRQATPPAPDCIPLFAAANCKQPAALNT